MQPRIKLEAKRWYGWQMLPGYGSKVYDPYFSPIWVQGVTPLKSGKGVLSLQFINVGYAEGVQDFSLDLRVLKREASYLLSTILYGADGPRDRTAIISHISFEWIQRFCPGAWTSRPIPSSGIIAEDDVNHYLNTTFQPDLFA